MQLTQLAKNCMTSSNHYYHHCDRHTPVKKILRAGLWHSHSRQTLRVYDVKGAYE